jgi:ABC-type oligopeptide transport system ATPase subunit
MVLHHGKVVEHGKADEVILTPKHDYTLALRNASPDPEKHFAAPTTPGATS